MWFKGKKRRAMVFVDYEHWYYGYRNQFHMKPNIDEWVEELKAEYDVVKLYVFGDFSEKGIDEELTRLKRITKDVVHTASTKEGVDKDFTDVIILDYIYRCAVDKKAADTYIIFTGDAHFTRVAEYLKELNKKVIVYGVKRCFSNAIKSVATSYVEMPRQEQERNHYNDLILQSLSNLQNKGSKPSYWKTIDAVSSYNKVPKDRIKTALDNLINQKYVYVKKVYFKGKSVNILQTDWKKINKDNIWTGTQKKKRKKA